MNLAWDFDYKHRTSKTCDSAVIAQGQPTPPNLDRYNLHAASQGWLVDNLPGDVNVAFDEIGPHYPANQPDAFRRYAERCTKKSVIAVEFTLTQFSKDCVDALLLPRNPLVRVAQEFFFFGEDGPGCHTAALSRLEWYISKGYQGFLLPLYCVSNSRTNTDKAKRAFSKNPGLVVTGWNQLLRRASQVGVWDAGLWGLIYSSPETPSGILPTGESVQLRDPAVEAWDEVLNSTYFR